MEDSVSISNMQHERSHSSNKTRELIVKSRTKSREKTLQLLQSKVLVESSLNDNHYSGQENDRL